MTPTDEFPALLNYTQVAKILGVSKTTINHYTKKEENPLPVIYLNQITKKTPRVRKEDLIKWMECLKDPRREI